jgi:F420-0:gamma-glutamyl ligase
MTSQERKNIVDELARLATLLAGAEDDIPCGVCDFCKTGDMDECDNPGESESLRAIELLRDAIFCLTEEDV